MARLIAFSVAGFKALPFDNPPVIPLHGITLLCGANSSGKSSVLQALRLVKQSLIADPELRYLQLDGTEFSPSAFWHSGNVSHDREVDRPIVFRFLLVVENRYVLLDLRFQDKEAATLHAAAETQDEYNEHILRRRVIPRVAATGYEAGSDLLNDGDLWCDMKDKASMPAIDLPVSYLRTALGNSAFLDGVRIAPDSRHPIQIPYRLRSADIKSTGAGVVDILGATVQEDVAWWPSDSGYEALMELDKHIAQASGATYHESSSPHTYLNSWLVRCGMHGFDVSIAPGVSTKLFISPKPYNEYRVRLDDVGDGARQSLAVLVQGLLSEKDTLLGWEHPDLHLHPRGAVGLARFAYRLAQVGRSIIVETHSEAFVYAVQCEYLRAKQSERDTKANTVDPVILLFENDHLSVEETRLTVRRAAIDRAGRVADMPASFYDSELRERDQFMASLEGQGMTPALTEAGIAEAVSRGEGQRLEFKDGFGWNTHTKRADDKLKVDRIKAVAAFLNSDGGQLIMGVENNGTVCGVLDIREGKQDLDEFERTLTSKICETLKGAPVQLMIRIELISYRDKVVAVVHCMQSKYPIYHGGDMYVRRGNKNAPLTTQDAVDYVAMRFPGSRVS